MYSRRNCEERRRPGVIWPLVFLLACGTAPAADYYVATTGSNTNTGGILDPWATVLYAVGKAADGDSIHIAAGEYSELIAVTNRLTLIGANAYDDQAPPLARHMSATILRAPASISNSTPIVWVPGAGARLRYLTIDGDSDGDGVPEADCGIYAVERPLTVDHCVIANMGDFGIWYQGSNNLPGDGDALRGYLGCNMITNIAGGSQTFSFGLYMVQAPSTVESNEIAYIANPEGLAAIYVSDCFYTGSMTEPFAVRDNYLRGSLMGFWANRFGAAGESLIVQRNTILDAVIGIRVNTSLGQAVIRDNTVSVTGVSPKGTPARGIWIQADYDPWNAGAGTVTRHIVDGNTVTGASVAQDGTVCLAFDYAYPSGFGVNNNGVRASVTGNDVTGSGYGIVVVGGTTGISIPPPVGQPLMDITAASNNVAGNFVGLDMQGATDTVQAVDNWWGSYFGPGDLGVDTFPAPPGEEPIGNPVDTGAVYSPWTMGRYGIDTDGDGTNDVTDSDDDNDGYTDADEVVAGTDAADPASMFSIDSVLWQPSNEFLLRWASLSGREYAVFRGTNLLQALTNVATNLPATPVMNTYTDGVAGAGPYFYRIEVKKP